MLPDDRDFITGIHRRFLDHPHEPLTRAIAQLVALIHGQDAAAMLRALAWAAGYLVRNSDDPAAAQAVLEYQLTAEFDDHARAWRHSAPLDSDG